jgi:hypothetical protein
LADGVTLGKVRVGKRDLPVVLGKDGRVRVGNFFADDVFREIQDRADAERSLHAYFKQAWGQIEGARPFVDSWHIGA